jgi:murein DD-endopeptidase MepM/ murein hydrolase activator NlpD
MVGQEVRGGEIIARSGATGRVTSPHLHYEVRMGHAPMNPYLFLTRSVMSESVARANDLPF